jgi:hypothetical protein
VVANLCISIGRRADYTTVSLNTTYGGSMGMSIDTSAFVSATGNTINGPEYSGGGGSFGIELAVAPDATVTGNTVKGATLGSGPGLDRGIAHSAAGSFRSTITGNVIYSGAASMIAIEINSTNATVVGNPIRVTNAASQGIRAIGASDSTISGNPIDGATTAIRGIMVQNCNGITVTGNPVQGMTGDAVTLRGDTASTVFNNLVAVGNVARNCGATVGQTLLNGATFGTNVVVIATDRLGFNGATPVVKAGNPGTATGTDAAVVNAVVTALRNLGLVT